VRRPSDPHLPGETPKVRRRAADTPDDATECASYSLATTTRMRGGIGRSFTDDTQRAEHVEAVLAARYPR
jgi:hypothetical protein